jgi:hypothetical protein
MAEDVAKREAIEGMFAAVEHIRACERCRRVYGAAFDVLRQEGSPVWPSFRVLDQCARELRACEHWPKGILLGHYQLVQCSRRRGSVDA